MPADFKWSPEAIEAMLPRIFSEAMAIIASLRPEVQEEYRDGLRDACRSALQAAAKAQPVVALPPCLKCGGKSQEDPVDLMQNLKTSLCPSCNGSGVERMVPVSEIVAYLNSGEFRGAHLANAFAAAIEREFGRAS